MPIALDNKIILYYIMLAIHVLYPREKIMDTEHLGPLAKLVWAVWTFLSAEGDDDLILETAGEKLRPKQLFGLVGKKPPITIVNPQHLPHDLNVKAVGFTGGRRVSMFIETTKANFDELSRKLNETQECKELEIRGRTIYWLDKPIIKTRSQVHFHYRTTKERKEVVSPRTFFTTEAPLTNDSAVALTFVAELLYSWNLFVETEMEIHAGDHSSAISMEMKQDPLQQQKMQQTMRREQIPLMAMLQASAVQIARRCEGSKILRMSRDKLQEYVREQQNDNPVFD